MAATTIHLLLCIPVLTNMDCRLVALHLTSRMQVLVTLWHIQLPKQSAKTFPQEQLRSILQDK